MAGKHRALRVALVLALASCAAPAWRDLSDPVTVEDLTALPAEVTPGNARSVARKCLQRHAVSASDVHRRTAYAFRERGFVQLLTLNAMDGGRRTRHERTCVDFADLESASSEIRLDPTLLRRRIELTLRGRFRRWETPVTPYTPQPELGAEPSPREETSFLLILDDPDAGARLEAALRLLAQR
jgi:hypothetical protein